MGRRFSTGEKVRVPDGRVGVVVGEPGQPRAVRCGHYSYRYRTVDVLAGEDALCVRVGEKHPELVYVGASRLVAA